jgi:hypothetical protein
VRWSGAERSNSSARHGKIAGAVRPKSSRLPRRTRLLARDGAESRVPPHHRLTAQRSAAGAAGDSLRRLPHDMPWLSAGHVYGMRLESQHAAGGARRGGPPTRRAATSRANSADAAPRCAHARHDRHAAHVGLDSSLPLLSLTSRTSLPTAEDAWCFHHPQHPLHHLASRQWPHRARQHPRQETESLKKGCRAVCPFQRLIKPKPRRLTWNGDIS